MQRKRDRFSAVLAKPSVRLAVALAFKSEALQPLTQNRVDFLGVLLFFDFIGAHHGLEEEITSSYLFYTGFYNDFEIGWRCKD